jgi:hypothetical protein
MKFWYFYYAFRGQRGMDLQACVLVSEEKALRKKGQLEALLKKHGIDPNEAE